MIKANKNVPVYRALKRHIYSSLNHIIDGKDNLLKGYRIIV